MKKILRTLTNLYGDEIPSAVLYQEDGLLRLWEINCLSALHYGLGNCHCVNHPVSIYYPVSTNDVIQRFGSDALDGFEAPEIDQLCLDTFGIEMHEMETYLRVSYMLGFNPLPGLRKKVSANIDIVFAENTEGLVFPEAEPGMVIFIVNSRGEISVREI